jgi:hypothetical protein
MAEQPQFAYALPPTAEWTAKEKRIACGHVERLQRRTPEGPFVLSGLMNATVRPFRVAFLRRNPT